MCLKSQIAIVGNIFVLSHMRYGGKISCFRVLLHSLAAVYSLPLFWGYVPPYALVLSAVFDFFI